VNPLVTVSQVVGEVVAGPAGALFVAAGLEHRGVMVRALSLAAAGVTLTIFFDLVTNLATGILFGQMKATLIGGIPFALWHTLSNLALFAALGTPLVAVFARYRSRLSR
jgi:hypothetical protein